MSLMLWFLYGLTAGGFFFPAYKDAKQATGSYALPFALFVSALWPMVLGSIVCRIAIDYRDDDMLD